MWHSKATCGKCEGKFRAELEAALAPLTKEGGNEKLAIRILARSLRLDQVLQIIGAVGWLIEEMLAEIFYTIRRAMQFYDEDSATVDKSWAGKLLSDSRGSWR